MLPMGCSSANFAKDPLFSDEIKALKTKNEKISFNHILIASKIARSHARASNTPATPEHQNIIYLAMLK